jgi:transcription elongation factor/antiterminator RfaH
LSELKDFRRVISREKHCVGDRWYVARTLPNREAGAASQLEAQGFRVFLPRIARTVRHARKMRQVRAPAFPGYLFVSLDLNRDRWRSVNGTFGVSRLIMADETPVPVPRGVVEFILDNVDETGVCRFDRGFAIGQRVRLISGPFAEQLGQLVRLDSNGRVRVLIEIMGGRVPALVSSSTVVLAC